MLSGVNVVLENTRNMTKKDAKKVEKDAEEWAEEFEDFLDDEELQLVTCLLTMVACGMRRYWKRCKDAFDAFMGRRNTLFHLFFVELFAMAFFGYVFQDLVAKSVFSWNAKFHTYDDMFTSGDEKLRACALMQCREFIWTFQFESTASATYCGFSPEEWSQISFQWIEMEYYVVAAGNWFVMLLLATIWLMVVLPVACRLGLCSTAQGSGRYMQVRSGQTYIIQIGSLQVASYGLGSVTLYPQGQVFRTQRFFHRFVCPMTFTRLPFDHQHCTIKMGSYSFGVKDLNITSYDAGGVALPSDYKGNEEFLVTSATSKVMLEVYDGTGEESGYSYLIIQLTLSRLSDCFMWFVVVTGVLFILVTYSGLFIDRKVAPARVAMAVIPVLIMLNLETSVRDSLPPLNTSTWLTGIIFLMKAFCLSAVFEYGVVSYLLQQETVHAEKFLAFKQLAAMIKRKEGQSSSKQLEFPVPSGKEVELVKPQLHQFPEDQAPSEGPNFLDITPVIESETPVALNSDSRCISRRSRTVAHAESMMMLEKSFAEAWRFFDLDNSGKLDQREVQVGFRRLGQYWSHRQVSAIFTELGIGDRDTMNKQDFKTFFMDVENYLPPKLQCSFWEQPPSLQVDKAFRWLYLIAMICGTVTYVVGYFIGDTQLTTKMD